jgi:hypothetical protein
MNPVILFYSDLATLIETGDALSLPNAEKVIAQWEAIKPQISYGEPTLAFLKEAFEEYSDENASLKITETIAQACFRDLCSHFDNEDAQKVFERWASMSGNAGTEVLFSHVSFIREHGTDGPVTLTITFCSKDSARKLLTASRDIEVGLTTWADEPVGSFTSSGDT